MNNYDFPDINTLPIQEGLTDPFTKPDGTRVTSIDSERIVATGHSRGGKTALCAAVYEERIAVTAPNSSGGGGTAGLARGGTRAGPQRLACATGFL